MFSTLAATVALAASVAMPVHTDNPWAANDWAPLKAQYEICATTSLSSFSAYVCMTKAHTFATTNFRKA